jgi:hypothetical protein
MNDDIVIPQEATMDRVTISGQQATAGGSQWFHVRHLAGAAALCVLLFSTAAQAAPLSLVVSNPDIFSGNLHLDYDFGTTTGAFTVTGNASNFTGTDLVLRSITGGTYNLNATLNASGVLQPGGTFSIAGAITSLGIPNSTLLAGNLTSFGFAPNPPSTSATFEFLYNVTSSQALLGFGPIGGTKLNAISVLTPAYTFGTDFHSTNSNVTGDSFAPVPEPSTILMMGLGLVGLWFLKNRHQTKLA